MRPHQELLHDDYEYARFTRRGRNDGVANSLGSGGVRLRAESGFELPPRGLPHRPAIDATSMRPHGRLREHSITLDMCTKSSSQSRSIGSCKGCVMRRPDAVWFCDFARRALGSLAMSSRSPRGSTRCASSSVPDGGCTTRVAATSSS